MEHVQSLEQALQWLDQHDFVLGLLALSNPETEDLQTLKAIRGRALGLPVVVIAPSDDQALALKALKAGAQGCLSGNQSGTPLFVRAVRYAVEHARFQERTDEAHERAARELGHITTSFAPSPIPVAQKSLGSVSLHETAPDAIEGCAQRYKEVLELALRRASPREPGNPPEEVACLADRLGVLNAGPRDVVDLRKAVITATLKGKNAREARALVEESRLLLLQLMGNLVPFYRSLS